MDTPVWTDYLAGRETEAAERFAWVFEQGHTVGLTGGVYQEVVQGVSSRREFEQTSAYLGSQNFYRPRDLAQSCLKAARMYFDCRRAGTAIRSSADCLIDRNAVEHDLLLLHDDRGFEKMAEVVPELARARGALIRGKDRRIIYNRAGYAYRFQEKRLQAW